MADIREEVFVKLLNLEDELDLFNFCINDVYIWERIRKKVFDKIYRQLADREKTTPNINKSTEYARATKNVCLNTLYRNPYLGSENDVLIYGNERRKRLSDGNWWDIISDPILEHMDHDWILYEKPRLHIHKTPTKTENIRYWDIIHYYPKILSLVNLDEYEIGWREKGYINKINKSIYDVFGVNIAVEELIKRILFKRSKRIPQYKRILKRIDPNVVLLSKSGRYTFIEACKDLDIPTIKLQTALRKRSNPKYSYPGKHKMHRTFADYKFVWGKEMKDYIEYPLPDENIRAVGFPFLEMEKEKYSNNKKTAQILFISQPTYGEELSKLATKLNKIPKINSEYNFVYKLHPSEGTQWRNKYPWLKNANINVVEPGSTPLYELLSISTFVIGVNSTVLYEAIAFDTNILIYDIGDTSRFQEIIKEDTAGSFLSVDGAVEHLSNSLTRPDVDKRYYFEENAIEKTLTAIDDIMDH